MQKREMWFVNFVGMWVLLFFSFAIPQRLYAADFSSQDELGGLLSPCQSAVKNKQYGEAVRACGRLTAALWAKNEFQVSNFAAVTRYAGSYGDRELRKSSTYRSDEPLIFYAEPKYYDFRMEAERYSYLLAVDVEIRSAEGRVLDARKDLIRKTQVYSEPMYALYFNLEIALTGAPQGTYDIIFTFRDLVSSKNASVTKRVTIQ